MLSLHPISGAPISGSGDVVSGAAAAGQLLIATVSLIVGLASVNASAPGVTMTVGCSLARVGTARAALSDAHFARWLRNPDVHGSGQLCVLVEVDYVKELAGAPVSDTLYFSTVAGYVTIDTDDPPNQVYRDRLVSTGDFERALDRARLGGRYSISLGGIEIVNPDGAYDVIAAYAFDGSEVRRYLGDPSWPKSDFRLASVALGANLEVPDDLKTIVLNIRDACSLLNTNIGGTELVGGTGPNADRTRPENLGAINNAEFVLKDQASLTYAYGVSGAPLYQFVFNVRDNGYDLGGTWVNNLNGTVSLSISPQGQITGDLVRGVTAGALTSHLTSDMYDLVAGQMGGLTARGYFAGPHSSFTVGDVQDYPLGRQVTQSTNALDICTEFADSSNSFYATDRMNGFYYGRILPLAPVGDPVMELTEDDIVPDTAIRIEAVIPLYDQIQCTGNRNWFAQTSVALGLTPDQQARYSRKGYYYAEPDPSGTSYVDNPRLYHKTMSKSPLFDTLIATLDDATARNHLAIWSQVRRKQFLSWLYLIDATFRLPAYILELGDVMNFILPRFNLNNGKRMQVLRHKLSLDRKSVEMTLVYREAATGFDTNRWLKADGASFYQQADAASKYIHVS